MNAPMEPVAAAGPLPAASSSGIRRLLAQAGGWHAWVLGAFSLGATLLLALLNLATRDAIEMRSREDLNRSLAQVIPAEIHDNDPAADTTQIDSGGRKLTIYRARRGAQVTGVAFEASRRGYSGEIKLLLGVDTQGRLLGVRVLQHTETPGLGDKIEVARSPWITRFTGRSLGDPAEAQWAVKKDGGIYDQFAGATITPRAVVNGVRDGLRLFAAQRSAMLEGARP